MHKHVFYFIFLLCFKIKNKMKINFANLLKICEKMETNRRWKNRLGIFFINQLIFLKSISHPTF
jgi:hypothetical protein